MYAWMNKPRLKWMNRNVGPYFVWFGPVTNDVAMTEYMSQLPNLRLENREKHDKPFFLLVWESLLCTQLSCDLLRIHVWILNMSEQIWIKLNLFWKIQEMKVICSEILKKIRKKRKTLKLFWIVSKQMKIINLFWNI